MNRKTFVIKLHSSISVRRTLTWALTWALIGCSSPTARERMTATQDQSRAHPAAYAADGFTMDFRSPPERPFRVWEFYYKHCTLVSRNPYPDRAEHYCMDAY